MHAYEQRLSLAETLDYPGSPTCRLPGFTLKTSPAPSRKRLAITTTASSPAVEAMDLGGVNPILAGDADSNPYAYSVFPDKATKATLADKMDGAAPLWT
jgi:hypothetical protein